MAQNDPQWQPSGGSYTITTSDGMTALNPTFSGYVTTSPSSWSDTVPLLPVELTVCQICGAEEVVVFCDGCKGILQLARKKWAETLMEEIEDALS